jgi:hypothetical protein
MNKIGYNSVMGNSLFDKTTDLLSGTTKVTVFVDMDGTITEYRFGEGSALLRGEVGVYGKKRPIKEVIQWIENYCNNASNKFYILSSCYSIAQKTEKETWIRMHLPFLDITNFICVISQDFESRIKDKLDIIRDYIKDNGDKMIIIVDDTHEILKRCWELNKDKILPVLPINLIK